MKEDERNERGEKKEGKSQAGNEREKPKKENYCTENMK